MKISSRIRQCVLSRLMFLSVVWLVVGCSSDEPFNIEGEGEEGSGRYLRIKLSMPSHTRSNPIGGEYGDGEEWGTDAENLIENLTLFVYRSDAGLNGIPATPLRYSLYVENDFEYKDDGSVEKTVLLKDFAPEAGDRLIVTANFGNLSYFKTLGDLRGHIVHSSWRQDDSPATAHLFTMANAYNTDGVITMIDREDDPAGTKSNPMKAMVSLERTAAKIDICFPESAMGDDRGLAYTAAENNDKLYLYDILPVNVAQVPSRLLKCVTDNVSEDFSCFDRYAYCADEMLGINGCQTNYVIEPKTLLKNGNNTQNDFTAWYGETSIDYVKKNYEDIFAKRGGINSRFSEVRIDPANSSNRRLTLTYANENTQHASLHHSEYLTGLLIKATYHPSKVYSDAKLTPDDDYACGETFYRYTSHLPNQKSYSIFFSSQSAAEAYSELHPDETGTITPYPGGECYYHGSIRHSNAYDAWDNHLCHPMEYAIVRNNVYIISFIFTGPGSPTPEFDDPESLKVNVYVRPWNLRRQSTILM